MKNFVIVLLALALVITGGWGALTMRERDEALRQAAERQEQIAETKARLEVSAQAARKERDTLQADLKKAQETLVETKKKMAAAEAAVAARATGPVSRAGAGRGGVPAGAGTAGSGLGGPSDAKPMKAFADMMKNPAMREMVKQQQLAQLDMQYAGLMSKFQLDDAEKANFKQLLGERLQAEGEIGLQLMDDSLTPEQRKALVQQITDSKKANEDKIKTFLNSDEDYKTFQNWEESKAERIQLQMGQSLFATAGEPLSPQQEDQLVGVMGNVRRNPGSLPDMNKPENFDPANLSQAMIDRQIQKSKKDADDVLQQARAFLSPKQIEALKTMQQQWLAMQETGLKMSGMMLGGKK